MIFPKELIDCVSFIISCIEFIKNRMCLYCYTNKPCYISFDVFFVWEKFIRTE